ncbi:MAG: hypothetical protein K6F09_02400 [Clostridiales bacterium]|nr:hypothetical protein [Clostridiales bacterium]
MYVLKNFIVSLVFVAVVMTPLFIIMPHAERSYSVKASSSREALESLENESISLIEESLSEAEIVYNDESVTDPVVYIEITTTTKLRKRTTTTEKKDAVTSEAPSETTTKTATETSSEPTTEKTYENPFKIKIPKITIPNLTITKAPKNQKYSPDDPLKDTSCFDNSAFIGNSQAQALMSYGLIPNADFFTKIGLSVEQALYPKTSAENVLANLNGKHYDKIFFVFGENELGWPYPDTFVKYYGKILDKAHEKVPSADLYIVSIFPVADSVSKKNTNGVTNENVRLFNQKLKELADSRKGVYFLNVYEALADENGALPEDIAADGIHFGIKYCRMWVNYMIDHVK